LNTTDTCMREALSLGTRFQGEEIAAFTDADMVKLRVTA